MPRFNVIMYIYNLSVRKMADMSTWTSYKGNKRSYESGQRRVGEIPPKKQEGDKINIIEEFSLLAAPETNMKTAWNLRLRPRASGSDWARDIYIGSISEWMKRRLAVIHGDASLFPQPAKFTQIPTRTSNIATPMPSDANKQSKIVNGHANISI